MIARPQRRRTQAEKDAAMRAALTTIEADAEKFEPPPPGYLLEELGYADEMETAVGLGITPQSLIKYRKAGIGPDYAELGGRIIYSRDAIARWLAAGGSRTGEIDKT